MAGKIPPIIGRQPPPLPPPLPTRPTSAVPPRIPPIIARLVKSVPPAPRKSSLLTPEELERFKNLLVFARATVEGYFVGKHKSPFRGSSVEFADYKEYVPGDEVNRIDWRAYGRTW